MSLFNTFNFESSGNTEHDVQLNDSTEIIESIHYLSGAALRKIKIYTPNLEYSIYANDIFKQKPLSFVRGNRHAQIKILSAETSAVLQRGHQLIPLTQRLPSSIQIRLTPEEYQIPNISFFIIDQSDFIYKSNYTKQSALLSKCKQRTNKLIIFFNLCWIQATQDPHSKIIRI